MFDRMFYRRVKVEMARWQAAGWVEAAGAAAILDDLDARTENRATPVIVLGGVGALLLATGVVTFIAAHWAEMPRTAKLGAVFAMLWASYLAAFAVSRAGAGRFAEAFVLLGALLFGAAIMLVGQVYHLPADPPGAVLLWCLGALVAAALWPSQLAALAATALALVWAWTGLNLDHAGPIFWPFLGPWAVLLGLAVHHDWPQARHAAVAALVVWLIASLIGAADTVDPPPGDVLRVAAALGTVMMAFGAVIARRDALASLALLCHRYGLLVFTAATLILLIPAVIDPTDWGDPATRTFLAGAVGLALAAAVATAAGRRTPALWLALVGTVVLLATAITPRGDALAMVSLGLAFAGLGLWLGLIAAGTRDDSRFEINLGFFGFAITFLIIYFSWFWTLFDRALFFMIGGVLVLGLGLALDRQRRRLTAEARARAGR